MFAERSAPGQPLVKQGAVPGLKVASPATADNPALTADERLIVFGWNGSGSIAGSHDLWYAVRPARDQPFGPPRQLPVVNTEHLESEVYITPDGCELFFVRAVGKDGHDIYFTRYLPR